MSVSPRAQGVVALFLALALGVGSAEGATDRYRLVWERDPAHAITVVWDQLSGDAPTLFYGPKDHGRKVERYPLSARPQKAIPFMGMDNRIAQLERLQPDTAYFFVIRDSEGTGPRHWFRTAPDRPRSFSFVVGSDTKSDPLRRTLGRRTNRFVPQLSPLFVAFAGDFTSGLGLDGRAWQNWLSDWYLDTARTDGRLFPIVPVRGNHESHPEILVRLFGLSNPDHYFAFDVGGGLLRFYALNTELAASATQREWLAADLAKGQRVRFRLAVYHKPMRPHTQSKPENDDVYDAWAELFHRYRMSVVVEGDSHVHKITYPLRPSNEPGSHQGFIRDDVTGTIYAGEGGWGSRLRPVDDAKPWTLKSGEYFHVLWFQVDSGEIEIRTVRTDMPAWSDTGSGAPGSAGPKRFSPARRGSVVHYPFQSPEGGAD